MHVGVRNSEGFFYKQFWDDLWKLFYVSNLTLINQFLIKPTVILAIIVFRHIHCLNPNSKLRDIRFRNLISVSDFQIRYPYFINLHLVITRYQEMCSPPLLVGHIWRVSMQHVLQRFLKIAMGSFQPNSPGRCGWHLSDFLLNWLRGSSLSVMDVCQA